MRTKVVPILCVLTFAVLAVGAENIRNTETLEAEAEATAPARVAQPPVLLVDEPAPLCENEDEDLELFPGENTSARGKGGKKCKTCPNPTGEDGCERLSCEPCCWQCPSSPYPICSS